jgi:hypothetical protein
MYFQSQDLEYKGAFVEEEPLVFSPQVQRQNKIGEIKSLTCHETDYYSSMTLACVAAELYDVVVGTTKTEIILLVVSRV